MKLKTLKIYIQTNLANGFTKLFKSPIDAPIFFVKKLDSSLRLCVNYKDLNNLTIENQYPFLFIDKFLSWLDWAKYFI